MQIELAPNSVISLANQRRRGYARDLTTLATYYANINTQLELKLDDCSERIKRELNDSSVTKRLIKVEFVKLRTNEHGITRYALNSRALLDASIGY